MTWQTDNVKQKMVAGSEKLLLLKVAQQATESWVVFRFARKFLLNNKNK